MSRNMFCASDLSLEEKVRVYWQVSKNYHSGKGGLTVEQALSKIGETKTWLDPQRPIAKRMAELSRRIVFGNRKGTIKNA
jgi:hypothetical protein